jgi:hypothetical protein
MDLIVKHENRGDKLLTGWYYRWMDAGSLVAEGGAFRSEKVARNMAEDYARRHDIQIPPAPAKHAYEVLLAPNNRVLRATPVSLATARATAQRCANQEKHAVVLAWGDEMIEVQPAAKVRA